MRPNDICDDTSIIRQSRRISTIAEALDLDISQVRRLLDAGELEAHGVGRRGVRIYLDSVVAYQERRARSATKSLPTTQSKPSAANRTSAQRAAMETLRRAGLLPK